MWSWGALEADFWRFYRIDLNKEAFTNRLSWRRFLVFVRALPEDSAFQRFLSDRKNRTMAEWDEQQLSENAKRLKGGTRWQ
ncbi:Gp15 family bacteriophage protein [Halalkalibacterium halodurans]|uniref:Gp15 family bacteriophage protein n=1 Tax=Halalkalibacterium halodurans TaxID=86665 RepID=UPI0038B23C6B